MGEREADIECNIGCYREESQDEEVEWLQEESSATSRGYTNAAVSSFRRPSYDSAPVQTVFAM